MTLCPDQRFYLLKFSFEIFHTGAQVMTPEARVCRYKTWLIPEGYYDSTESLELKQYMTA